MTLSKYLSTWNTCSLCVSHLFWDKCDFCDFLHNYSHSSNECDAIDELSFMCKIWLFLYFRWNFSQEKLYSWLVVPLRIFRIVIDFLTNVLYGWIYEGDRSNGSRILPPIRDVILLDPANVLAEKIRTRKIKSVELLEIYVKRIGEVNDLVNCMVDSRFVFYAS